MDIRENSFSEQPERVILEEKEFFPKGALVFFALFMLLLAFIWGFIYFIMIFRGGL